MPAHPDAVPTRARIVFRIGVTGHRNIDRAAEDALRRAARTVLRSAMEAAEQVWKENRPGYSTEPPRVRVVSSLAKGADTVVAQVADELARDHPGRYELQAPIPFLREDYEKDFHLPGSPDPDRTALDEFDRLTRKAHFANPPETRVLELGCDHSTTAARLVAYEAAGRVVLQQCDLLIVVLSPEASLRQGGTSQMNREASDFQVPAVVLDPDRFADREGAGPATVVFQQKGFMGRRPSLELPVQEGATPDVYPQVVEAAAFALRPPAGLPGVPHAAGSDPAEGDLLAEYLDDRPGRLLSAVYGLPRRVLVKWCGLPFRPGFWKAVGDWLATPPTWGRRDPKPPNPEPPRSPADRGRVYDANYDRAHALSVRYAVRHRGAFMWNYLLGAAAVTCGLLAAANVAWHDVWAKVELLLVLLMLANFWFAHSRRWQARSIQYRVLAEHFRHMRFLHLLGLVPPDSRHPHYRVSGDPRTSWTNWYLLAVVRDVGLMAARVDAEFLRQVRAVLRDRWLGRQVAYHKSSASKNAGVARFLDGAMWVLLGVTVVVCSVHLFDPPDTWLPLLTLLAAGLPAWGAAFHAIATQAEFERARHNSERVGRALVVVGDQFDRLGDAATIADLIQLGQIISEVLLTDVMDWQVLYEMTTTQPI